MARILLKELLISHEQDEQSVESVLQMVKKLPFEDREQISFYARGLQDDIYFSDPQTEEKFPHIVSFLRSNRSKETLDKFLESGAIGSITTNILAQVRKLGFWVSGKL